MQREAFNDKFKETFSKYKDSNSAYFYMDGGDRCYNSHLQAKISPLVDVDSILIVL